MSSAKPFRMRVRVIDGKPREPNKLKGQLAPHMDVLDVKNRTEFVFCFTKQSHLEQIRAELAGAGLEEIPGGDTLVLSPAPKPATPETDQPRRTERDPAVERRLSQSKETELKKKPYAFVPLPEELPTASPVWHDGTGVAGRLSGEIRFELRTLTPLLVGWERRRIDDADEPWPVPCAPVRDSDLDAFLQRAAHRAHPNATRPDQQRSVEEARRQCVERARNEVIDVKIDGVGLTTRTKSVLCPLRAPWGVGPVLLPGDSIKGLLRHELGALLGAPMERVAERSYSYRPNLSYPQNPAGRFLEPRLARVKRNRTVSIEGEEWPFPDQVDVLKMATRNDQKYYPHRERDDATKRSILVSPPAGSEPYKGGLGGGRRLPDAVLSADARRRMIHTHIDISGVPVEHESVLVPDDVAIAYAQTLKHLFDSENGHFGARHPNVGTDQSVQREALNAIRRAARGVFSPGDLIWVEWDTQEERIVSLGWHYYYRWAYSDTVRKKGWTLERHGLFPLAAERAVDDEDAPQGLSPVRRLFGYTGDNDGSKGIGKRDHEQLMGRLSVNAAIEVIENGDTTETRFLPPTFLRELGMPRPSAVEHYLKQPHYPDRRPSDQAMLVTYGDAAGYDEPGGLAGRKFYLDRPDAYDGRERWEDDSEANRLNDRSTVALEASRPDRRFRFTVRFRDLDPDEVAAIVIALCPHQFRDMLGGTHPLGYCSKLGYARPLGWGSVRIEAKELLLLDLAGNKPVLSAVPDLLEWVRSRYRPTPTLSSWLDVHRHKHPDAADYPRGQDGEIYSYHTQLRATHIRKRRYAPEDS
jgi:hypothetical protein